MKSLIREIENARMKKSLSEFNVGDTVDVHVRIREGEKTRIQIFKGVVIAKKGSGLREVFVVRRIVQGEGVERTFPLHSPNMVKVVVKKRGRVRRAKLYYLRDRVGKATKVREKFAKKTKESMVEVPDDSAEEQNAEQQTEMVDAVVSTETAKPTVQ